MIAEIFSGGNVVYVSAPNSRPFNLAKQTEVMDRKKHVKG